MNVNETSIYVHSTGSALLHHYEQQTPIGTWARPLHNSAIADLFYFRYMATDSEPVLHYIELPGRAATPVIRYIPDITPNQLPISLDRVIWTDGLQMIIEHPRLVTRHHRYVGLPKLLQPPIPTARYQTLVSSDPLGTIRIAKRILGLTHFIEIPIKDNNGIFQMVHFHQNYERIPQPAVYYRIPGQDDIPLYQVNHQIFQDIISESSLIASVTNSQITVALPELWPKDRWYLGLHHAIVQQDLTHPITVPT